jgi:lipid-binding SYLF domain-containing protein
MKVVTVVLVGFVAAVLLTGGCSPVPNTADARNVLDDQVKEAIDLMKQQDPSINTFFDKSYGYAVLPKIFKGAWVFGGAGGKGEVFERTSLAGYCSVGQASIGFSFGGQFFREIVFFRDKSDLDTFRTGEYTFSAQAMAVAITSGAAAKADYKSGLAVFIMSDKGLMVDASVGGQKFRYTPRSAVK